MSVEDLQREARSNGTACVRATNTTAAVGIERPLAAVVTLPESYEGNKDSKTGRGISSRAHFVLSSNRYDRVGNNSSIIAMTGTSSRKVLATSGGSGAVVPHVSIGTKPTIIEKYPMRFMIMDAPRQSNLHLYIKEMRKNHVTEVVRVCEPTYRGEELSSAGIGLHELEYKDGTSPSKEIINAWLHLVETTFYAGTTANGKAPASPAAGGSPPEESCTNTIAIHCVAGLGRAPQMVAIALIEFANMDPVEAVHFIRTKRRGAINEKQLLYLEGYKKQYKRTLSNVGKAGSGELSCCVIL